MQLIAHPKDSPIVGIVQAPDPDYRDLEGRSVALPEPWFDQMDAIAERASTPEATCERFDVATQLIRWSLGLPDAAPQLEGPELKTKKRQATLTLSRRLWALVDAECERRGLSVNKVIQAHLFRGLKADGAADASGAPAPRKQKRQ